MEAKKPDQLPASIYQRYTVPVKPPWYVPLVSAKADKTTTVFAMAHSWEGVEYHWLKKQAYLCPGKDYCDQCKRGRRPRFRAYVACCFRDGKKCLLELTRQAVEQNAKLRMRGDLFALKIDIVRIGQHKGAPVVATVSEYPEIWVKTKWDAWPAINRIYAARKIDPDNPLLPGFDNP